MKGMRKILSVQVDKREEDVGRQQEGVLSKQFKVVKQLQGEEEAEPQRVREVKIW